MFDFNEVAENDFGLIPDGKYPATIVTADLMRSKGNSDNVYIKTTFKIFGDKYDGRMVFHNFNVINSNDIAKNIAMSQIKQILVAVKHKDLKFTKVEDIAAAISNKPMEITVGIKKDKTGDYADQNVIKSFGKLEQETVKPDGVPF